MSYGEILKDLRGNTPIGEVAEAVGVSKSAMHMYERSERRPRDEVKVRIAEYYKTTVEAIFYALNEH